MTVVSQVEYENMDNSEAVCFDSNDGVASRENPVVEQTEQSANSVFTRSGEVMVSTESDVVEGSMSAEMLQKLITTLTQTIQSEISKHTDALEGKLIAESKRQTAEAAKQAASLLDTMDNKLTSAIEGLKTELRHEHERLAESLIARSESANAAIWEKCEAKISSEIRKVTDKVVSVSRDTENKITKLNEIIENVRECMNDRINAHEVQAKKVTDRQGQEITKVSSSMLASINEHKEQIGLTVEREINKSKECTDNKFGAISREIRDIKQNSAAEIAKLGASLDELRAKLVAGTQYGAPPDSPARADVGTEVVQQIDKATCAEGSNNTCSSVHGVNDMDGCGTSVSSNVNGVINQSKNLCNYGNVNAVSELHAKGAELCELTLPTFSDSAKQVPLHFIRDLDQYFNLRRTPDELRLPLVFRAIQEPFAKQWLSSSFDKLKGYEDFKQAFTELLWNPSRQASIRSSIYLDKYDPKAGESYMDHYIRYANLASTLEPPMTEMDLLSALTSHFEPRVQQGLICGNFKNSQDALAFLAKFQGLGSSKEGFRAPRNEYDRREANRRTQDNPNPDDRRRDRSNYVNMRYVRNQASRGGRGYSNMHQDRHNGRNLNGRAQGRVGESVTNRLNPTAPRFNPTNGGPMVGQNPGNVGNRGDDAPNLND